MVCYVNYGDLVRLAFETARAAPDWARGWCRKRVAEHLSRDNASSAPAAWEDCRDGGWGFIAGMPPEARAAAESVRAASARMLERARAAGETPALFVGAPGFGLEARLVHDWLHALPDVDPGMIAKLDRVTFAQALRASERWHAALERRALRDAALAGDPDAVESVLALENGARWVELLTPEARDFEGAAMGHCAGTGAYDRRRILSLRDASNRPHITVELDQDGAVVQIQGRGNGRVAERYIPAVMGLIDHLRPPRVRGIETLGCIHFQGQITRISDLPEGACIEGDLELDGDFGPQHLPRGLHVRGHLVIEGWRTLRSLPPGLKVEGGLDLYECTGLEGLPEGIEVGGRIVIDGCTAVASLPRALDLRGDLDIRRSTALEGLPEGTRIGGDLRLESCPGFRLLPQDLRVDGRLFVAECPDLARFPAGARVGGDLEFLFCASLEELPDTLDVRGHMRLKDCPNLESLPDVLDVARSLRVEACESLRAVPDGVRVGGDALIVDCPALTRVGRGVRAGGHVVVQRCGSLRDLPDDLRPTRGLDLRGCASLERLPEGMRPTGDLDLRGCTSLAGLPEAIDVGGRVFTPDGTRHADVERARGWFEARARKPAP